MHTFCRFCKITEKLWDGVRWIPAGDWSAQQQRQVGRAILGTLASPYKSRAQLGWTWGPLDGLQSLTGFRPQKQPGAGPKHPPSPLKNPPAVLWKIHKQIAAFSKPPLISFFEQRGLVFRAEATSSTLEWGWTTEGL